MFNSRPVQSRNSDTSIDRRPPAASGSAQIAATGNVEARVERQPAFVAPTAPIANDAAGNGLPGTAGSTSRLVVGPAVKLKGAEILDCDTLVVEGRVEATMDSRVITVAQHGAFVGKVGIEIAEIHGNFEGELTARQQLLIHATGRVKGKIRYGKLLIEAGGIISGDVEALTESHASTENGGGNVKPLPPASHA